VSRLQNALVHASQAVIALKEKSKIRMENAFHKKNVRKKLVLKIKKEKSVRILVSLPVIIHSVLLVQPLPAVQAADANQAT